MAPRNIHTLLFDLDQTLYPKSCGLATQVSTRITQYMEKILKMPADEVDKIRNHYYKTYGLTLKGLMIDHQVDINDYLDYVHGGLNLKAHIGRDERLIKVLASINPSIKKIIFSNADLGHCQRVTKELGVDNFFDDTIEYLELGDFSKPHPVSYQMAMKKAGTTDAAGCVFFDDVVDNLEGAKKAGMITVLVGGTTESPSVDYCIQEIHDIVNIFPDLIVSNTTIVDPIIKTNTDISEQLHIPQQETVIVQQSS
ncbi:haloacid dehalogenase-like hydrolase [Cavenderia fasciculata]|uniref:Haloacid dehalogenase-like hydrolase n=1 Tax=Cavenderia fasciculata TaxID=261658 RepID=F4Q3A2_CACFS|nr:haloacid dehalogenase-like hydrolase [Cavenderia fasciculata]EGG17612.1 haloacid dehalogenase-like hydrolase [Cavenderia fasciculata]|eukprot:XP_004356096.1 haloacid dehalogenase-like hydrolase [Cavenderia fasciculata]